MKKNFPLARPGLLLTLALSTAWAFAQNQLIIADGELRVSGTTQIVLYNTQWVNNATFTAGEGTVVVSGTTTDAESALGGDSETTFYNLDINKAANGTRLEQNIQVDHELTMLSGDLDLHGDTCTLGTAEGILLDEAEDRRVTGTTGGILRKTPALNAPAGENPGNVGVAFTSDQDFGSTLIERGHVAQDVNGVTGVYRYYRVTPTNNTALNATARFHYFDAELNGDLEAELGLWRQDSVFWFNPAATTVDTVADYQETDNIDFFSLWTLAPRAPQLHVQVLLEGPYTAAGTMNDDLRTADLIPTDEPYAALGYDHAGGGGEKIDPSVLTTTGDDAIVDWIFVELRDATNTANVLAARSALLQRDGDVVDLDGTSHLSFPGVALTEMPLVAVRHRNHLGVIATNASDLTQTPALLDFTTDPNTALGGTIAMSDLGDGFYGLFSGDFDGNGQVQNTDATGLVPNLGSSGYVPGDCDLNGQVQNTDLQIKLTPNLGRGAQFGY